MKNGVPRLQAGGGAAGLEHRQDLAQVGLHRLGREPVAHADLHVRAARRSARHGAPGLGGQAAGPGPGAAGTAPCRPVIRVRTVNRPERLQQRRVHLPGQGVLGDGQVAHGTGAGARCAGAGRPGPAPMRALVHSRSAARPPASAGRSIPAGAGPRAWWDRPGRWPGCPVPEGGGAGRPRQRCGRERRPPGTGRAWAAPGREAQAGPPAPALRRRPPVPSPRPGSRLRDGRVPWVASPGKEEAGVAGLGGQPAVAHEAQGFQPPLELRAPGAGAASARRVAMSWKEVDW